MRALTALCIACLIGLHGPHACAQGRGEHDTFHTWYRGLKSPEGDGCCNERDCHPVASRYTAAGPEGGWALEILIRKLGQGPEGPHPAAVIPGWRRTCLLQRSRTVHDGSAPRLGYPLCHRRRTELTAPFAR